MGGNGYRLLGFVVWKAGRWYLRRRVRSVRVIVRGGVIAAVGLAAARALARRATG
jgi:hypothetical protein